jgi:hypothetical protein
MISKKHVVITWLRQHNRFLKRNIIVIVFHGGLGLKSACFIVIHSYIPPAAN